jgi:hypothetical protein
VLHFTVLEQAAADGVGGKFILNGLFAPIPPKQLKINK